MLAKSKANFPQCLIKYHNMEVNDHLYALAILLLGKEHQILIGY